MKRNYTKSTHVREYLSTLSAGNLFYARSHPDVEKILFLALTDRNYYVRMCDGRLYTDDEFLDEYDCELNETLPNDTTVIITVGTVEPWQEVTRNKSPA